MTMTMAADAWTVSGALAAAVLVCCLLNVLVRLVWRPHAIARRLRRQGVHGPGYKFFVGNLGNIRRLRAAGADLVLDVASHDFIPISQPQFRKWISLYGRVFLYWFGWTPNICVADFGLAKQVLADRAGLFLKHRMNPVDRLVGKGLVMADGVAWRRHETILHPAFDLDKLKTMTPIMVYYGLVMVSGWERTLARHGRTECVVELTSFFEELTVDVISRTTLGSSYKEGRQVYLALKELQLIAFSSHFTNSIPGFRYVPTQKNIDAWRLEKYIRSTLVRIIENRLASKDKEGYGNDLLGQMLEACAPEHGQNPMLSMDEIVDECKTFFLAGQETSLHMLTWTMFLLSTHPEWQEKLREEVLRDCGRDRPPIYETLKKLKLANLFLLETLRLYSPVTLIRRRAKWEFEMGGITVPRGALLTIPIAMIHRDKEVWGDDADEFNPMRFDASSAGATKAATHVNALMSFSMGPRRCIGQNFAMVKAKAMVALILQRFLLTLHPKYVHAPTDVITLRPRDGISILITKLDA